MPSFRTRTKLINAEQYTGRENPLPVGVEIGPKGVPVVLTEDCRCEAVNRGDWIVPVEGTPFFKRYPHSEFVTFAPGHLTPLATSGRKDGDQPAMNETSRPFVEIQQPPQLTNRDVAEHKLVDFERAVEKIVNALSLENLSDTPDFMLAKFLAGALTLFNDVTRQRTEWYGKKSDREFYNDAALALPPNSTASPNRTTST